jgi:ArsR family transcriptional regulator, arsenate/arsenite/antimonite-responsive transcriptional repressor
MESPAPAALELFRAYAALGDATRWRIAELLAVGERCVCDLASDLGMAQSRLSYHLSVLLDAGLISQRKDGRWMYYSLNSKTCEAAARGLVRLSDHWQSEGRARSAGWCR